MPITAEIEISTKNLFEKNGFEEIDKIRLSRLLFFSFGGKKKLK